MDNLKICPVCGKATEKIVEVPTFDGTGARRKIKVNVMCKCRENEINDKELRFAREEELRTVDSLKRISLIDSKLKGLKLSDFVITSENQRLKKIVERYIQNFDRMYQDNQGLLFWGGVGSGKSFAAAVIANELLNKKISVIMTSFVKLLDKSSSKDGGLDLERLNQVKLLILDDLGTERGTDFALEKVYDFINNRYLSKKPIILTTNLTMDQMKNCEDVRYTRIYDRIFEMCYPVRVEGFSWRKKEAKERYERTKMILEG